MNKGTRQRQGLASQHLASEIMRRAAQECHPSQKKSSVSQPNSLHLKILAQIGLASVVQVDSSRRHKLRLGLDAWTDGGGNAFRFNLPLGVSGNLSHEDAGDRGSSQVFFLQRVRRS